MSFRKGRAPVDGVTQARSLDLQRTASNTSARSGKGGSEAGEPVVVVVTPSETPLDEKAGDDPAVTEKAVEVASPEDIKEGSVKLDTPDKPPTTSPEINRAPSPDLRFAISTATATPEDSITRVATPQPEETSKVAEIPPTTPPTTLPVEDTSKGIDTTSKRSSEDPIPPVESKSPITATDDTAPPASTDPLSTSTMTSKDTITPEDIPAAVPTLSSSEDDTSAVQSQIPQKDTESPAVTPSEISEPPVPTSAPESIEPITEPAATTKVFSDVDSLEDAPATSFSKDPRIAGTFQ